VYHTMMPFSPWSIAVTAWALAGCTPTTYRAPPPEGPSIGTSSDWLNEMDRASTPPPRPDVTAFRADLDAVCFGTKLSRGAKAIGEIPSPGCRLGPPLTVEIEQILALLKATPKSSPDWIRIVDRLAGDAFLLEHDTFRVCVELSLEKPKTPADLERMRAALPTIRKNLKLAQHLSQTMCEQLAKEPVETHAPCDFHLPLPEENVACREETRSIPRQMPAPVCEPSPSR